MQKSLPLTSFCIFTYNQQDFIRDAIRGAFAQEYGNLEIIISDDCSTDNTYDIILSEVKKYKGNHTVRVLRNEINLGIAKHVCKVLYEEAKGEYLVLAGGDDISQPLRTITSVTFMEQHPDITSLSVTSQPIDVNGKELTYNGREKISLGHNSIFTLADYINYGFCIFSGDSRVLRKSVINAFPPLKFSYAEDIYFFVRSLYIGSIALLRTPLVLYRQHPNSVMGKNKLRRKVSEEDMIRYNNAKKQLLADFEYAIEKGYIKEEDRNIVSKKLDKVIYFLKPQEKGVVKDFLLNWKISILQRFHRYLPNLYNHLRTIYRGI